MCDHWNAAGVCQANHTEPGIPALSPNDPLGAGIALASLAALSPACNSIAASVAQAAFWALVAPWVIVGPVFAINVITVFLPMVLRQWLLRGEGPKRLPQGVWTVHGKKYDLSSWAKHHPGGPWAIELGRNRDCTGLFESYHVFADRARLDKTLARFEIRDDSAQEAERSETAAAGPVYSCPFHEDVKQLVREHFADGKTHKMKPWVSCIMISLVLLQILNACLFLMGYLAPIALMPFVGWLLTCNVTHDGSHFSVSKRPWLNWLAACTSMPMCFSPTAWHIQHVVQHHVNTNDEDDVDLYHFLPIARTARNMPYAKNFRLQGLSIFFALPTTVAHLMFVVPCDLLSGQRDAITGTKRYHQCTNVEDLVAGARLSLISELLYCTLWAVLNLYAHGLWGGAWRVILSWCIASYLFIIFTQGAHLNRECMDEKSGPGMSWARRQVATAVNFSPDSYLWLFLSGGLNMQGLHHVVPGIGSWHLIDLWPRYREVCVKHGVELKEAQGIVSFFRGFLSWVAELAENAKED